MTTFALKEWDTQCQALTSGRSALLIRKGGIMETHEGFEVEHRAFLLYPTFLHQNPAELRPEFTGLLRDDPELGKIVPPPSPRWWPSTGSSRWSRRLPWSRSRRSRRGPSSGASITEIARGFTRCCCGCARSPRHCGSPRRPRCWAA